MLLRTCFAAAIVGLVATTPGYAQQYYSQNRTAADRITTVSFGSANEASSQRADVAEVAQGSADANADATADQQTIAELRKQIELMSLRLREVENDVAEKLKTAKPSKTAAVPSAQAIDHRFKALERNFESQGQSIDKIESTIPGLVHTGHGSPKINLIGRINLDYTAFPDAEETIEAIEGENPQDRVEFRRLRLGVKGDLSDNVFYKYEGEFAGGNSVEYRDAYIGFKELPFLNTVIIGNHKRPYGLDNLNSSRFNVFNERPLVIEAFNEDARRLGISSNGVSNDQSWNWRYGLWHQELTQDTSGFVSDHYQPEVAGRIANTAWYDESSGGRGYFHWAVAGSWGVPDGRDGSTDNAAFFRTRPEARTTNRFLDTGRIGGADANSLIGIETVANVGALQITAEYQAVNVQRRAGTGDDLNFDGGYVQAAYFLTGEHTPWNRQTGTLGRVKPFENFYAVRGEDGEVARGLGAWQVAARYSYADLSDDDIFGGRGDTLTLGLNWWWNPNARLQFNYIFGEIEQVAVGESGNGNFQAAAVRWAVDF